MAGETTNRNTEFERELTEIQAELDAMEREPTIERARFEALKVRVAALKAKMDEQEQ